MTGFGFASALLPHVSGERSGLQLDKDSSLIEQVAHAPHHEQHRGGLRNGSQFSNKVVVEGEHPNSSVQPLKLNLAVEIDENRIPPLDEEWKGPFPVAH